MLEFWTPDRQFAASHLVEIIGLGLLDALNPFSIAALVLVLAGTRPLVLGSTFIAATFAVYLLAGYALLAGWSAMVVALLPLIPDWVRQGGLALLGVLCVMGAIYLWVQARKGRSPLVEMIQTSVVGTAIYAASSTASDLPTAIPYFAAVPIMVEAGPYFDGTIWLLLVYNLLYVLPLIVLLAIRVMAADKLGGFYEVLQKGIDFIFKQVLPLLTFGLGLYCLWLASTL
jgi:Sap, sulfolipid-1-addressing protein